MFFGKTGSFKKTCGILALIVLAAMGLTNCGGGNVEVASNPPTGTIRVSASDPPPCKFPDGMFKHVYVSVRAVQAHVSSTATDSMSGWQELATQLAQQPMQIDLLSQGSNQCTLGSLGSNSALPTGSYQQIRLLLVANSPAAGAPVPSTNACGNQGFNCVVLSDDSVHRLELSSQANTGLKIPPGQIMGGPITVGENQVVDLNIDFNTCAMIVLQGNGQYRLKPALTAGQVSQQTSTLSGQVVDSATMQPVAGGTFIVALEETDSMGVNHIRMETTTGANGNFTFCPLPMGTTFDVVVVGTANGTSYGPTALLGVSTGANLGAIPVIAETGMTPLGPATIMGTATSSSGTAPSTTGFAADIAMSAHQPIMVSGATRLLSIPLQGMDSTKVITTASGMACPMGTNCADYKMIVPASNPSVGTFAMGGTTFAAPAAGDVLYTVRGSATVPLTSMTNPGAATCSPATQTTDKDSTDMPLKVTGGMTSTAKRLDFTGCM